MNLTKIYIYRITHIENIRHIIQYGITHRNSKFANANYKSIGDNSLISTREDISLKDGSSLGEYIPFYFGVRSPMLYVIQNGFNGVSQELATNIVYCVSSVQKIIDAKHEFIYTDGHATDRFSNFFNASDVKNISEHVDFDATKRKLWKDENDLDLKRRKEAEFLIKNDLEFKHILGFITFDEDAKSKLIEFGVDKSKVAVRPTFYY